jgi:hypothetical protein
METHKKTNGRIKLRGIKVRSGIKERSEWIDAMQMRRACDKFFASRGLDRNGYRKDKTMLYDDQATTYKEGLTRKRKHDWRCVDWSMPTGIIADMMGLTSEYVSNARQKYAPETVQTIHQQSIRAEIKWKEVDWSKSDVQIARETGCTHGAVWKARRRQSQPNQL